MPGQRKVLITGATGFIDFRFLLDALHAGWQVRITARTEEKLALVLQNQHIKPRADAIEAIAVPGILTAGAYKHALPEITPIIHAASPLPFSTEDPVRDIIEPAVQATETLLAEALTTAMVQRVVITSSLVFNMPYPPPPPTIITAASRVLSPSKEELAKPLDFFTAYGYSKILSLTASDAFRRNSAPHFDIINVIPGFVHGANLLATADTVLQGSNRLLLVTLLVTLLGQQHLAPRLASAAHIEDVSRVHICALSEEVVPRGSNVDLAISRPVVYDDA